MAASLSLRVYTSTGPTESATKTGIDLISADNDTNSLANRQANPITVGTNSYEKWLKLKIDTAPANGVTNFKIWGDGGVDVSTTLKFTSNYATYQQGTDTRTDHNVFLKELILETSSPGDMRAGTVKLTIPEFSIHTFEAPHNKITWYVRVHGDIKSWPDISEEYVITVLPLQA